MIELTHVPEIVDEFYGIVIQNEIKLRLNRLSKISCCDVDSIFDNNLEEISCKFRVTECLEILV